jgi:hypothetical protein
VANGTHQHGFEKNFAHTNSLPYRRRIPRREQSHTFFIHESIDEPGAAGRRSVGVTDAIHSLKIRDEVVEN